VPTAVYAAECVVGSLPIPKRLFTEERPSAAVAVLVPAHNEESGIAATLVSICSQLHQGDRLVVVADNCTDETAAIALMAGAEVVERRDNERRGKGYALDAGIRYLSAAAPDIVVMIDADCTLGANTIDRLVSAAIAADRPIQARYLMIRPGHAKLDLAVAEFAFLVKNHVRPLGLARLDLPCQLTGSGMAIPWAILSRANLAHGNVVEDMQLGLDLARIGFAPQFCEGAAIFSEFPVSKDGLVSQRHRWESGHLATIRSVGSSLFDLGVWRNPAYLAMVLDVIVPPLTLLILLLVMTLFLSTGLAMVGHGMLPAIIAAANVLVLATATAAAWTAHGRKAIPVRSVGRIPFYVLGKLKLYPRTLISRASDGWIRTDRKKSTR
jgi:cellulose synthase/poly-beta-1,6-N-acetylglucosamine synthase-like glycosyltransferase